MRSAREEMVKLTEISEYESQKLGADFVEVSNLATKYEDIHVGKINKFADGDFMDRTFTDPDKLIAFFYLDTESGNYLDANDDKLWDYFDNKNIFDLTSYGGGSENTSLKLDLSEYDGFSLLIIEKGVKIFVPKYESLYFVNLSIGEPIY